MYDNLAKVLQEANALIDHYNQLNKLATTQNQEINDLTAENIKLKTQVSDIEERTRP